MFHARPPDCITRCRATKLTVQPHTQELWEAHGIIFSCLFALNNMPIKRYVDYLQQRGGLEAYMQLLVQNFNVAAAEVHSQPASCSRICKALVWVLPCKDTVCTIKHTGHSVFHRRSLKWDTANDTN